MQKLIKQKRNRLIQAKLDGLMHRTGSHYILVKLGPDNFVTIQLTEEWLEKALKWLFEVWIYDGNKRSVAEKMIADHYDKCVGSGMKRMSPLGAEFMNSLLENLGEVINENEAKNEIEA